jgi:hypothetical protein
MLNPQVVEDWVVLIAMQRHPFALTNMPLTPIAFAGL